MSVGLESGPDPHGSVFPEYSATSGVYDGDYSLLLMDQHMPDLFRAVASHRDRDVFSDGKTIVDSSLKDGRSIAEVNAAHEMRRGLAGYDPNETFLEYFDPPEYVVPDGTTMGGDGVSLEDFTGLMWDALRYKQENDVGTLIGTPNDAFKPGERFLEAYYWDTADAATCLLQEAAIDTGAEKYKKEQWVVGLVDNMKHMIERFGYVPNGQRSYYLGRSQPPIFAGIVEQLANYYKERDPDLMERYLPAIVTEYKWWMKDEDKAGRYGHPQAMNHVVRLDDGLILNRHFGLGKPRPESRDEDLRTARDSGRNPVEVFQNLAAGAESGRDYDAADFDNFQDIETIRTINLVKPQLNALLGQSERIIAGAHNTAGRSVLEKEYRDRLARRVAGMNRYNYNSYDGAYYPYDFVNGEQVAVLTMETAYPVARGLSDDTQSDRVTDTMNQMLLQIGGYSASSVKSSQQWSYENGFARDQAEARAANIRAGKEGVALEAATRWLERDDAVYHRLGALAEKNNVVTKQPQMGQGGEYFAQRGFLWSIAVNRQFQRYVVQRQRANLS